MTHQDARTSAQATIYDIGVIGAGSATETLVGELRGSGLSVVVFEQDRVGGECPFVACMPSKTILHVGATTGSWEEAVARRSEVTENLDDASHAEELAETGAVLVRSRAQIIDADTIEAGGEHFTVRHIVVATGSESVIPDIVGLDSLGDRRWTSVEALTAQERPDRLVILGGGVIGCELGLAFARLGSTVTLLDADPHGFADLSDEVGDLVDAGLRVAGVTVRRGTGAVAFGRNDGLITVDTDGGDSIVTDRVLVAIGKRARVEGIGLEALGLDPADQLEVDETGRVACAGSVWAMGDVAGRGQYTHLASHQARVVADHLAGGGTRRFDDVTISSCVFTDPPVIQVGPSKSDLDVDPDVIWASGRVSDLARAATDDLGEGFLAIAARRSSGSIVAAHGAGPRFEELVHALVIAVDGAVPLDRLVMSMHAFPTVGEILRPVYEELLRRIRPVPAAGD